MAQWGPDPSFIPLSVASKHSVPKSTCPKSKNCQVLWAGVNRYALSQPAKKSQPSQRMVLGPVLAGSSPSWHLTLSSRQPGRRAGFQRKATFFPSPLSSWLEHPKVSVAQSRAQAQAYQARQKQLRAQAREIFSPMIEEAPLFQRGGFKPFLEA